MKQNMNSSISTKEIELSNPSHAHIKILVRSFHWGIIMKHLCKKQYQSCISSDSGGIRTDVQLILWNKYALKPNQRQKLKIIKL